MRSSTPHLLIPSAAGTICRVIRQGAVFYCGMCRSSYDCFSHAMNCVGDCWAEVLRLDPVISRHHGRSKVYHRCRFCARDYGTRDLASQCAVDCRERFKVRLALELEAWGQVEDLTAKPPARRRVRRSLQLVAMPVMRKKPVKEVPAKEPETHAGDSAHGKDTPPSHHGKDTPPSQESHPPETPAAAPPPPAKQKKVPREPFSRDGAQYVCNGCQKKYFTKGEVVTCFESHAAE